MRSGACSNAVLLWGGPADVYSPRGPADMFSSADFLHKPYGHSSMDVGAACALADIYIFAWGPQTQIVRVRIRTQSRYETQGENTLW